MRRTTSLLSAAAIVPLVGALLAAPAQALPTQALTGSGVAPASVPAAASDPEHVPVWDHGPGGERVVAFGDSFVSGPGIQPVRTDVGCMRSEKNFPTLVAQGLEARSFVDASCGGATTVHFTEPQPQGDYTNAPQLDALSRDTTLVTFGTMGGNDIGLVQLAGACVVGDCVPAPGDDPLAEAFAAVEGRLVAALDETRRRAPQAEVLVVGYGTYLPPGGCPDVLPLPGDRADYLQSQIDRLSDLLERIAGERGVAFVDQRDIPGAVEHTVCAAPEEQWIRGLETYGDGILMHPSTAGMRATADYLTQRLGEVRPEGPPQPPTRAERRAALKQKAATVRASSSCLREGRRLRVRVRGGQGAVTRASLWVGGRWLARDVRAPYVLTVKAAKVKRHRGALRVRVVLRDAELKVTRGLRVTRPRCARR
ncbi:SGNH/GDSL hydrolase family protein [Nocardioides sp. Y6]|uniref:SGNH/GDSL hydrolase family protein n=1 Tax=Nocardioides malaquae TaxID=2773426 RepID=A0ABR9RSM7_9ACTN|nr:SGNH/GDSL hydrolase family protein [Nocardioides malaquae]MBE7324150.1 SGNH/GDSL hydrolase family protein [Nocardioides malaquae]